MSDSEQPEPKARMPRQIPYIIASEGCERFSFYGMRNILQMFLSTSLLLQVIENEKLRDAAAKDVLHTFMMGVYFFPLLGGWLADRFFGKFNTILVFSLIYCAGHGCLALWDDNVPGFYTGLFLIAFGAGGIKPLVASFVGDQFDSRTKHLAKKVFDAFYWIINFGSFFASILMPLFLKQFGSSIAFGIPGALMLIATIVLWLGRKAYIIMPASPKDPNSFGRVVKTALTSRRHDGSRPGYFVALGGCLLAAGSFSMLALGWLDFTKNAALALVLLIALVGIGTSMQLESARGKHPDESIDGVRAVLRVLIVFALVTPFHSLFDQKTSTWVIQGNAMEKPAWFQASMMQALNPALVMILIPFNNFVLYPWMRKRGYEPTSLRRMTWGIVFSAFAWIVIGVMQLVMDGGTPLVITWQILPYALLTFGEVLVSATGLEFAYSQAPLAMKGVIMSFWNLTTTVGNLWVLLSNSAVRNDTVRDGISGTGLSETAFLMFFFAAFALAAAAVFKLYARRYTVVDNYRANSSVGNAALPTATARNVDDK